METEEMDPIGSAYIMGSLGNRFGNASWFVPVDG